MSRGAWSVAILCCCGVLTCFWFLCDPGDTLYYRFTSDMSNTEWGYKFTVTAGHLGRFQTGVCPGLSVCRMSLPGMLGGGVGAIMSRIFVKVKAGILIPAHGRRDVLWWLAVLLRGWVEEGPVGTSKRHVFSWNLQGGLRKGGAENVGPMLLL